MHAITLVTIYNYVLFGFRSNIIFIILYDLHHSDLCVYLIRDPNIVKVKLPFLKKGCLHRGSMQRQTLL